MKDDNKIHISKKGFHCTVCDTKRKGAYRIVDGYRSCEKCNREYDYVPNPVVIECPTCKQPWRVKE